MLKKILAYVHPKVYGSTVGSALGWVIGYALKLPPQGVSALSTVGAAIGGWIVPSPSS